VVSVVSASEASRIAYIPVVIGTTAPN
jgi:hypothetical protein